MDRPSQHHVLMVASCAPRPHRQRYGSFVHDMALALCHNGYRVSVLVPVRVCPDQQLLHSLFRPWRLRSLIETFRRWINLWLSAAGAYEIEGVLYVYKRFFSSPSDSRNYRNGSRLATSIASWWPTVEHYFPKNQPLAVMGHFLDMVPLTKVIGERTGGRGMVYLHEHPAGLRPTAYDQALMLDLSKIEFLLSNSYWNLQLLNKAGFVARHNAVLPLPLTHPSPVKRCKGLSSQHIRLLYVARFTPNKQHDLLLDAIAQWLLEKRQPRISLTLLGDEGSCLQRIAKRIQSTELKCHVHICHYHIATDLHRCLLDADAFISTSKYESFGMALFEAAAVGLPVVSSLEAGFVQMWQNAGAAIVPIHDLTVAGVLTSIQNLVRNYDVYSATASDMTRRISEMGRPARFVDEFSAILSDRKHNKGTDNAGDDE